MAILDAVRVICAFVRAIHAAHAWLREPPTITAEGVRRMIDVVWDAEGYAMPKAAPERYFDLDYSVQAACHR